MYQTLIEFMGEKMRLKETSQNWYNYVIETVASLVNTWITQVGSLVWLKFALRYKMNIKIQLQERMEFWTQEDGQLAIKQELGKVNAVSG